MKTNKTRFDIFDKRDGAPDAGLQFKTLGEILGLPWNGWLDRSCSGFAAGEHEAELRTLIRKAKRDGETILGASISNYAVSIAVAPKS